MLCYIFAMYQASSWRLIWLKSCLTSNKFNFNSSSFSWSSIYTWDLSKRAAVKWPTLPTRLGQFTCAFWPHGGAMSLFYLQPLGKWMTSSFCDSTTDTNSRYFKISPEWKHNDVTATFNSTAVQRPLSGKMRRWQLYQWKRRHEKRCGGKSVHFLPAAHPPEQGSRILWGNATTT